MRTSAPAVGSTSPSSRCELFGEVRQRGLTAVWFSVKARPLRHQLARATGPEKGGTRRERHGASCAGPLQARCAARTFCSLPATGEQQRSRRGEDGAEPRARSSARRRRDVRWGLRTGGGRRQAAGPGRVRVTGISSDNVGVCAPRSQTTSSVFFREERKGQRTLKYHILRRQMTPPGAPQRKLSWDAIEQIR